MFSVVSLGLWPVGIVIQIIFLIIIWQGADNWSDISVDRVTVAQNGHGNGKS